MSNLPKQKAALHKAARVLGGQAAVATVLGYPDRRNVAPWFAADLNRPLPAEHCLLIERATREAGEVVTCEELRPDVAWDVIRKRQKVVA